MNKIINNNKVKAFLVVLIVFFTIQGLFLPKNFQEIEHNVFFIEKGQSVFEISQELKEAKLIRSSFLFNFYVFTTGNRADLKAGQYSFSQSMSTFEIIQKIIKGKTIREIITIPEGWNLRDIAWFFENKGLFQAEEILEVTGFPAIDYSVTNDVLDLVAFQEYDFYQDKLSSVSLEGYLFPDTYELEKDFSVEDFVKKALDNFEKKIDNNLRQEIKAQDKTIFSIITMASLIEREAKIKSDKEIVSGILWKRAEIGMPLQVDATILYFTGKTIEILKDDLETSSPYNTYKNRGLPLGPICNPGMESILASINPESSDYWYYLSTPQGEIVFSKTLEEHNIAKANYLK